MDSLKHDGSARVPRRGKGGHVDGAGGGVVDPDPSWTGKDL